jgi:mono/diheme cytochrome c family protein
MVTKITLRKISTLACGGLLLLLTGCRARQPGAVERAIARQVKQKITVRGKDDGNPLAGAPEDVAAGQKAFSHYCIVCHGLDGQNTGVPFADNMSPPVPPLTIPDVQRYADGQLKWIISNGVYPSGMPAWKGMLSDEEMWQIVQFIRQLPPPGSLGVPAAYREDNPKPTPATRR